MTLAAKGELEKVKAELKKGININLLAADGLSTLQWAIAGDTKMLEFLLKAGANPDVASIEGATPMMNAVQSNKIDHLKVLIEHKADVNQQDNRGFTALHRAVISGHTKTTELLLHNGADPNAKDITVFFF